MSQERQRIGRRTASELPEVCVVLPTYNGGRYVGRQIESVLSQTYPAIKLVVRDDGSTDDTVDVVRSMIAGQEADGRLVLLEDGLGNLGCPQSFYRIIEAYPDYPYYAFCDQDDVWLPNKVERAVAALRAGEATVPSVYFSSFDYCDEHGQLMRHAPLQPDEISPYRTLYYTPGLGFTIAFNQAACRRFILDVDPGDELHDRWILRCAAYLGCIISDRAVTAQHLRHAEAVTADDRRWVDLVRGFVTDGLFSKWPGEERRHVHYFLEVFDASLTEGQKREIAPLCTPGHRMRKLLSPHRFRSTMGGEIALRILFALGRI